MSIIKEESMTSERLIRLLSLYDSKKVVVKTGKDIAHEVKATSVHPNAGGEVVIELKLHDKEIPCPFFY